MAAREAELRQLRKSNTDYEQQNAILQKHMENMQAAVDKLTAETQQQKTNNEVLHEHYEQVRSTLAVAFSNLPLPGDVAFVWTSTMFYTQICLVFLLLFNPSQFYICILCDW